MSLPLSPESSTLAFAHLLLIWCAAAYLRPTIRPQAWTDSNFFRSAISELAVALAIIGAGAFLFGTSLPAVALTALMAGIAAGRRWTAHLFGAPAGIAVEFSSLGAAALAALAGVRWSAITVHRSLMVLPVPASGLRNAEVSAVILIFAVFGGGTIVLNVLTAAGTFPPESTEPVPASPIVSPTGAPLSVTAALRHGRIIGYLERLIAVAAVAGGHYDALSFLIAAKGLIRARELEDRARAEYFLVGTFTSMAVAVAAGICIAFLAHTRQPL